jgi:hypothetical protein
MLDSETVTCSTPAWLFVSSGTENGEIEVDFVEIIPHCFCLSATAESASIQHEMSELAPPASSTADSKPALTALTVNRSSVCGECHWQTITQQQTGQGVRLFGLTG